MAIISPGQSYSTTGAPDVHIVEASQLRSLEFNNGLNDIGIVGESNWGPETGVTKISNMNEAIGMFGTRQTGNLVKYIETIFNIAGGEDSSGTSIWVKRVTSDTAGVKASRTVTVDTGKEITFTALYGGTFGNLITTQITAGSIGTTFNLNVTIGSSSDEWYYSEDFEELSNVTTDENYFLTILNASTSLGKYLTVTKTGTFTDIPAVDATAVALSSGSDFTVADGNYLTAIENLKDVTTMRGVCFAKETTSALYTGLKTFCESIGTCIGFACPEDDTSTATVVAEMASKTSAKMVTAYPNDYQYYNREDDADEDQAIAWAIGITFKYQSNQSPINKPLPSSFGTAISESDLNYLQRVNVFCGGFRPNVGQCVRCARLETRDTTYRDISMTRRAIDIEADLDASFILYLGSVSSMDATKTELAGIAASRLNHWVRMEWLHNGYDAVTGETLNPYNISFPDMEITEFNTGVARISIHMFLAPTIEHIIAKVYRNQSYL